MNVTRLQKSRMLKIFIMGHHLAAKLSRKQSAACLWCSTYCKALAKAPAHLVNVWVHQGHVVIAGNAVAQGVEPLIYPLHNHLIRETVAHVHELCSSKNESSIHQEWAGGNGCQNKQHSAQRMLRPIANTAWCILWLISLPWSVAVFGSSRPFLLPAAECSCSYMRLY